jgi:signal transduction histidine kinase
MPETTKEQLAPGIGIASKPAVSARSRTGFYSTAYTSAATPADAIATSPIPADSASAAEISGNSDLPWLRINWEIKALVPIACVLLGGMLLFLLATLSWRDPERHIVLLVAGAGAVAICGALLVVLTYTVQRPMVELQQEIAQLGRGDLSAAVSFARRNDEIGDLGRNFNRMVQQLRESRTEIEQLHRTQMSRAEHLATLGEMATGLAHEIRNPLAGIAGVIEIISRDLPATSPARSVVKDVRQEIARINHIVTDLLQTARPHPPTVRRSDLNTTVEHAVMLGRQQAQARAIQIALYKDSSLPEVEHDSDQIHQLLLNLLLNALQAIDVQSNASQGSVGQGNVVQSNDSHPDHAKGKITVTVKGLGNAALIEVADNGRGIPSDQLPSIFRPFYTTKGEGTGLGLSLARRIVEDHQGRIDVASAVGQGTTFAVVLPLQRAAVPVSGS